MAVTKRSLLVITNLYPVPWAPNRASFNKQQFDLLSKEHLVNILVMLPWREWLQHKAQCKSTKQLTYCPYFQIPKIGRPLVPFFQLLSLLFFLPWIKKCQPTHLMASWGFPDAVAAAFLNKFISLPFFIKVHGTDVNENTKFTARSCLIKNSFNKAKTIFCASQALADVLTSVGVEKEKLKVNYNGVNADIFYPLKVKPAQHRLVFVGSLIATKGVNELFSAFVIAQKEQPLLELDILGEGPLKAVLAKKIIELNLSNSVRLVGSVPLNVVAEYIRSANALVLPSYREGVPNVLLESFASGTPVISTTVGGIPEVVNDNVGVLVNAQEVNELVLAINKVITTPWSNDIILQHAKQFDWQHNVQLVFDKMGEN